MVMAYPYLQMLNHQEVWDISLLAPTISSFSGFSGGCRCSTIFSRRAVEGHRPLGWNLPLCLRCPVAENPNGGRRRLLRARARGVLTPGPASVGGWRLLVGSCGVLIIYWCIYSIYIYTHYIQYIRIISPYITIMLIHYHCEPSTATDQSTFGLMFLLIWVLSWDWYWCKNQGHTFILQVDNTYPDAPSMEYLPA